MVPANGIEHAVTAPREGFALRSATGETRRSTHLRSETSEVDVITRPDAPTLGMSKISKASETATSAVSDGWISGGSLFSSVIAGTLIGLGLDAWLDTEPWFVVIGAIAGSVSGFYQMWAHLQNVPKGKKDLFDGR